LQSIAVIQSGPEKFAQNLMHRDFATDAVESSSSHQNAQKLTGNMTHGQFGILIN